MKQIAAASFDKMKDEIKAALANGSKLALSIDAWTGRNHTKYLGVIGSWILDWQLKDGLLGLIPYDPDTEGSLTGDLVRRKLHQCLARAGIIPKPHVSSFTSDSGGDMAKCAQICMKEDGTIAHVCGAHCVQLPPKLIIFSELFNKEQKKRKLLTHKGGRQLSEREFDDLVQVRLLSRVLHVLPG